MSSHIVLFFVVLTSISLQVSATSRCEYVRRESCGPGGPCSKIEVRGSYLLIPPLLVLERAFSSAALASRPAVVQRCDDNGCSPVEVWAEHSGAFLNVWATNGGYILKLFTGPEDTLTADLKVGDFVEVATLWLGAWVSTGRCPGWANR
jgi:hypothetical protein